ncbi:MAG: 50S ribosomal protein L35ae [Candidatus Pacearchaeota archaeon]|nr:50S ribosomal protein L35ae [Candidatus Pacearchaeota archaeon]
MKGKVVGFRRGKKTYKPRHFILQIENIESKEKAKELIGKKVFWKSPSGKKIAGMIKAVHGNKGLVRAVFEKGLPGQAINTEVEVEF